MINKLLQVELKDSDKYALTGGLVGIIDSAMDAVITINAAQRILLFNPAAELMFGCKSVEAIGSRVDRFIPERFRKAHEEHIRKFGETGETSRRMGQLGEIRGLRTNGEEFPIEASISQVNVGGTKLFSVILRDVTERKRDEEALREKAKEIACLYAVSHDIQEDLSGDELYRRAVEHLVSAMQFPEITVPVIELDGKRFTSENYTEGLSHDLHAEIRIKGETIGHLRVYYAQDKPFLIPKEQNLINSVAEAISIWLERKHAEEALKESQKREQTRRIELETLMKTVPLPVWVSYDRDCRIMTGNKAAYELTNLPIGSNISETAPDGKPHFNAYKNGQLVASEDLPMQKAARTRNPTFNEELEFRFVDGRSKWVYGNAVPLRDETGNVYGALGAFIDITQRKQMETAIQTSERKFRAIYEQAPLGIALLDSKTGHFLQVNQKYCEITKRTQQELLKLDFQTITHPEDLQADLNYMEQLRDGKIPYFNMEKRYIRPDDSIIWVALTVVPMWEEGEPGSIHIAMVMDTTERKRAEEMLRKSEEQARWLATFPKENPDMVLRVSLDGTILYCNPAAARQETWKCSVGQPLQEPLRRLIDDAIAQNHEIEREVELEGTYFSVAVSPASAEGYVNIYGRDITKRKRAEEELRESEEKFRVLTENAMAHIGIVQGDRFVYANPYFIAQSGYTRDELLQTPFVKLIHPDYRAVMVERARRRQAGETVESHYEFAMLTKSQEKRLLDFSVSAIHYRGNPAIVGIAFDITERKQAEEQLMKLAEELKRSNTDLEQFAFIASHDLKEPLRAIRGFVELLDARTKDKLDEKDRQFVKLATDGVQRMEELLMGLLEYSSVSTHDETRQAVSSQESFNEAIANLKTSIEETNAAITSDALPEVKADGRQLTRVFQNLIANAIKFRGQQKPEIHAGCKREENEWIFWVRDNGIGIDPKFKERIFNIFQKLHAQQQYAGHGLGLTITKRIIERHGGRIWVESEEGKGATFYFTIPV